MIFVLFFCVSIRNLQFYLIMTKVRMLIDYDFEICNKIENVTFLYIKQVEISVSQYM